jgi:ABC-type multidrug transport system fused ATPase/permease subunit
MLKPDFNLIKYSKIFISYLGFRTYLIFALTLASGLAESFGIVMLMPLIQSTFSGGVLTDEGQIAHDVLQGILSLIGWEITTTHILIVIAIAFIIKGLLLFFALSYIAILRAHLLFDLKTKLYSAYERMDYQYYSSKDSGHFINVINEQITRGLQAFKSLCRLWVQIITATLYLSVAIALSWKFGLVALIAGLVILMLFQKLNTLVNYLSRRTAEETGNLSNMLIQMLYAFKYLTAVGQIRKTEKKVFAISRRLSDYYRKTGIANALTSAIQEPIAILFVLIIVFVQINIIEGGLTTALVSMLLFYRGINSIIGVQALWQGTLEFIGSMELVHDEFNEQRDNEYKDGKVNIKSLNYSIRANSISFSYKNNMEENVISGLSFEIPAFSSVAFVGESGSGKSTIADIITMVLRPTNGELLIDGLHANKINSISWRKQIGYVSQDTIIFNDTIENNIGLWLEENKKDRGYNEQIRHAAKMACIHNVIEALPNKYSTIIGERGVSLSGGQLQRLFIARELFRKPKILILDEATSALDSESQALVQESIDLLKGKVTVIIITHRFSTIKSVDKIYVLEKGRIIEQGDFKSLKSSKFTRMLSLQKLGDK